MDANYLSALLLTALAGLSTTIGSIIGIFVREPSESFRAFTLGFAAGVMILVSFVELLAGAIESVIHLSRITFHVSLNSIC